MDIGDDQRRQLWEGVLTDRGCDPTIRRDSTVLL
jgi:hypothetical protein